VEISHKLFRGGEYMNLLNGKRALVTGGARGIGLAIARKMAEEGARVIINDIQEGLLDGTVKKLLEVGLTVQGFSADITDEGAVQRMFRKVEIEGGLHILVNNAGGSIRGVRAIRTGRTDHAVGKLVDIKTEDWSGVLSLNLTGTFLCTRAAVPLLKSSGQGRIINISSKAGRAGGELSDIAYVTTKAGLIGFTKQCAKELGPWGITSNAVAPGLILSDWFKAHWENTDQAKRAQILRDVPLNRPAEPEEIATVCTFLASDWASYITGVTLDVNGGWYFA